MRSTGVAVLHTEHRYFSEQYFCSRFNHAFQTI